VERGERIEFSTHKEQRFFEFRYDAPEHRVIELPLAGRIVNRKK
jgi:hypothetical protein